MTFEQLPVKTQMAITAGFRKHANATGAKFSDKPTYIAGFIAALHFVADELEKHPQLGDVRL